MGAKRMPTMKNNGRTLLGVRIGLRECDQYAAEGGMVGIESLTARLSIAVDGTQYLENRVSLGWGFQGQ